MKNTIPKIFYNYRSCHLLRFVSVPVKIKISQSYKETFLNAFPIIYMMNTAI